MQNSIPSCSLHCTPYAYKYVLKEFAANHLWVCVCACAESHFLALNFAMVMICKCYQRILLPIFVLQNIICAARQEFYGYNEERYSEIDGCIFSYTDLEAYILDDKAILKNLTEAFFRTDISDVTKFLRITYNVQMSSSTDFDCTYHPTIYIWSEAPLYLLGPKHLFFLTLFAVDVSEISVTIKLPCLCRNFSYDLLSRLTYMVRYS